MKKAILGKKVGMTQMFLSDGTMIPVTVIEAGPCPVVQKKTVATDGYDAIQVGFSEIREKLANKPLIGHCAKAGYKTSAPTHLREFRTCDDADIAIGTELKADVFAENDYLDVTGTIKGRGFQGVVKRYNFGGGRASHGGAWTRRTGSIGMCEFPGRVWLGKRMPGHMGNVRRTIQNLQIVRVMAEDNVILVKGAVPGANGGILLLRKAIKK